MDNNYNNGFDPNTPVQPLFSNDFNNTVSPTQPVVQPGIQPEVQTVIQPSAYQVPTFEQPNNVGQVQISNPTPFQTTTQDIPPVLPPIQGLTEAPVVSAPTLDVLGPMNIIPEVPSQVDPLTNYENGVGTINQDVVQQQTQPYQTPSFEPTPVLNQQQISPVTPVTTDYNTIPPFEPQTPVVSTDNFETQPSVSPVSNNYNSFDSSDSQPNIYGQLPNLSQAPSYQIPDSSEAVLPNTPEISESVSEIDNNINLDLPEEKSDSYEIVNKLPDLDNNDINDINDINELGIEEPLKTEESDMIDIEDTSLNETEEVVPLSQPAGVTPAVTEVKDLVEKLKQSGYNVSLEEFDFEQMFQLIIKINK